MPWLRKYREDLGISGEARDSNERNVLAEMSKDMLVNNLLAVEQQYKTLLSMVKNSQGAKEDIQPTVT